MSLNLLNLTEECYLGNQVGGNSTIIETNGFARAEGEALAWRDFNFSPSSLGTTFGSNPDIVQIPGTNLEVAVFAGSGGTTEEVSTVIELNHEYAEGTDIRPHIHWAPTTTATQTVRWQLEYAIVANNTVVSSSTTIFVDDATSGNAFEFTAVEFPVISGSGLEIGNQVFFRLFRDPAGDTYTADAAVATFGFHYQIDTNGSRSTFSK